MKIEKQLHLAVTDLREGEFVGVRNDDKRIYVRKPMNGTGLWTSTFDAERRSSGWVDWCQENEFLDVMKRRWYLLTPREVNLYVVDSVDDLLQLMSTYGYTPDVYKQYKQEIGEPYMNGVMSGSIYDGIDFERMSKEYDGMHLTEWGNTHLSMPIDLNAWDCESTLWFRWCFSAVEQIEAAFPVEVEEEAEI